LELNYKGEFREYPHGGCRRGSPEYCARLWTRRSRFAWKIRGKRERESLIEVSAYSENPKEQALVRRDWHWKKQLDRHSRPNRKILRFLQNKRVEGLGHFDFTMHTRRTTSLSPVKKETTSADRAKGSERYPSDRSYDASQEIPLGNSPNKTKSEGSRKREPLRAEGIAVPVGKHRGSKFQPCTSALQKLKGQERLTLFYSEKHGKEVDKR